MAKSTVRIYDSAGNVVEELPYGTNGITGTNGTGQRQQVHMKIDENGNKTYFAPGLQTASDPFEKIGLDIDEYTEIQAPQVSIKNGQVFLNAPQEVLDSPISEQIRTELQSLKGADLDSEETKSAINALNEEIRNTVKNWTVKGTLGWTEKEFADYQRLLQAVRQANPMSSGEYFIAKRPGGDFYYNDEEGREIMSKTPEEWIKYWKEIYTTDERTQMYKKSLESTDPYERVMGLIMSAGGAPNESGYAPAVYGYDTGEYLGKFWETMGDYLSLLPKGLARMAGTSNDVRRVEDLAKDKNLDLTSMNFTPLTWSDDTGLYVTNWTKDEDSFNSMRDEIRGKSWDELSDIQKLFVLEAGASKEDSRIRSDYRELSRDASGIAEDLKNVNSSNETVSRSAIEDALIDSSYDRVKQMNNDLLRWKAWDEENVNSLERKHADDSLWAAGNVGAGAFAGVIGRFVWENMLGKALTGKSMSNISDAIGDKVVGWLGKIGVSPTSKIGQGLLNFTARLLGTVPEDIVQTSVDNVLTNNAEENANLLDINQMSENFKMNLLFMTIANGAKAGWGALKIAKTIQNLKKMSDLDTTIDIEKLGEIATEAAKVYDAGGYIEREGDEVYKVNADGTREKISNMTPDQADMVIRQMEPNKAKANVAEEGPKLETEQFDEAAKKATDAERVVDDAAKSADETVKADEDTTSTVKVEEETPDGKVETEVKDYDFKSFEEATDPTVKVEATPAGIRHWHPRALNAIMRAAATNLFREFRTRFGDVRASDFDWVFKNINEGKSINEIIGSVDPTTKRVIDQNKIDAMKWWADHPMVRGLRMLSREALGEEGDYNKLGYLPHTNYDPSAVTFEEARTGQLWKRFTGKSMQGDNGEYVGYGGTLEGRYRTFASNMLWDMRNKEIIAAKLVEEAELDGKKLSSEEALKMADRIRGLDDKVNNAKSTKDMVKGATKNGSDGEMDFKKAGEEVEKEAPNSGAGKAIHDIWADGYRGANKGEIAGQPKNSVSVSLDTQGDTMRKIEIFDMGKKVSMYEGGAADLVYAPQNAFELVSRIIDNDLDWKEALTEFIMSHSKRSRKYAEIVADRMLIKLAKDSKGRLTKGKAINSLSRSFRSEAWARYRRWLVISKYDEFSPEVRKFIDDFTFRHMQMDSFANNKGIISKVGDAILELRYDALFYGNLKNALLQLSELSRLLTEFKLGDVGTTLKKLATDEDFRRRVDIYVNAVAPNTKRVKAMVYDKYGQAADSMEVKNDGVRFKKFKDGKETLDDIALAPIETAEAVKNRTMVAALVAEADRLGYTGNEALMYIRQRFERVALAQNEMGRISLSSNPVAKPFLFLKSFQMRELGMHYYNIFDPDDLETGKKMKAEGGKTKKDIRWNAAKYLMKVFGTKLGTTLVLSRLGYGAAETLGLDPLGISNNYSTLSDDEKTIIDEQISNGFLTPFASGGIMSLFAEMYFMAREAYEDANRKTISDEAESNLDREWFGGTDWEAVFNLDNLLSTGTKFVPGYTAFNRAEQMNEMMSSGWATSSTGNKMYMAPDDLANTILGYLFGRSATQNALNYSQNYGNDLGQTLSRTVGKFFADMGGGYDELDAIDKKYYTDWFDGSENDTQQFEKGRRSFQKRRDNIIDTYENALRKGFGSDSEEAEAKNDMNEKLEALYDDVKRFVDAYEKQHGTITGKMVKELVNLLNQERKSINDTGGESNEGDLNESDKALERYAQLGLPNVGTYTGPSKWHPETEVKYQGSPQWRVRSGARYDLNTEATQVLRAADAVLEDLRKQGKQLYNEAYQNNDYTEFNKFQKQYLEAFDNVVGPVIATYGNGILSNKDVKNQLEEMLATSTNTGKVNLIPSEQYAKDKWGRYRSMPFESVDVGKWAQERYSSSVFQNPTIRSSSTAQDDIDTIKRLINNGQEDMARARALALKVRIDNQKRSLGDKDYQWLLNFLNNGGK